MNAVKTQIWIAIGVYLIVAIIKKKYRIEASLYSMLQVLSISLFEKVELTELLNNKPQPTPDTTGNAQICFFDYLEGTDV